MAVTTTKHITKKQSRCTRKSAKAKQQKDNNTLKDSRQQAGNALQQQSEEKKYISKMTRKVSAVTITKAEENQWRIFTHILVNRNKKMK